MVNALGFTDEEEQVVALYLDQKQPPLEKLRRMNERIATMLSTNASLQGKLQEQEIIVGELQGSAAQLEISVAEQDEQLNQYKDHESELVNQLTSLHQGQRSEELRMRSAVMMLEERLNVLIRENTRLEEQKRDEEVTLAENAHRLHSIEQKLVYLRDRKAALEPEELSSIRSESGEHSEIAAEEIQEPPQVQVEVPEVPAPVEAEPIEQPPENPFPQAPGIASSASMLDKAPKAPEQGPSGRRRPGRNSLVGNTRGSFSKS